VWNRYNEKQTERLGGGKTEFASPFAVLQATVIAAETPHRILRRHDLLWALPRGYGVLGPPTTIYNQRRGNSNERPSRGKAHRDDDDDDKEATVFSYNHERTNPHTA
jgi:hypothetical protein